MTPAEFPTVGIVERHHPLGQTCAAKGLGAVHHLKHSSILSEVRVQIIMKPQSQQIIFTAASGMRVNNSAITLAITDDGQFNEVLQSWKLRPTDASMQEHTMKRIYRIFGFLQPVIW